MNVNQANRRVVLVSRDLFFYSNIQFMASSLGAEASLMKSVPNVSDCHEQTCYVVDLELPGLDYGALGKLIEQQGCQVIGYAPHVKTDLFESARNAGVSRLFTRGQLNQSTQQILSEGLSGKN